MMLKLKFDGNTLREKTKCGTAAIAVLSEVGQG